MSTFEMSSDAYQQMRSDLFGDVEHVGFFLANYDDDAGRFYLEEWMPIPSDGFELQLSYHVSLTDETIGTVLQRAGVTGRSLVEVHSHLGSGRVAFSPTDIDGLREWVPSVRWRLRGRPYAAMVWDATSFDAVAWIDSNGLAEQVTELRVAGVESVTPTGLSLPDMEGSGPNVSL
jgi:hypothetical protein